ncbi:AbrB family transcriptional regulator [Geitlerinema sp. P-1104]|uniref:AbrB/MazE/SpoVT family DNA-binding domain-containing protein n=1 Tax=Geitlerinema sp. P-1104 TaxID=2546230 RepID=UPI00147769FB|nr:AbrB/MazE/SpoVT family DNA-binding domain-containing protein [Geitlerinema sp. P-1104]NMG59494.1 AbrB family transcriptional regulator [Geitlerinema sp. P-1104]
MALTRITPEGTATIPPEIIDWLQLKPGDRINIAISPDGKVYLEPAPKAAKIDVRPLSGCLYKPDRKPVSLGEMEPASLF